MVGAVAGAPMSGVSEALVIGARGGMAATVGGSEPAPLASAGVTPAGLVWADLTSKDGAGGWAAEATGGAATDAAAAGAVVGAGAAVISRTSWAARSASRRLRSSDTVSLGCWRDAFLTFAGFGLGCALAGGVSGSTDCAVSNVG